MAFTPYLFFSDGTCREAFTRYQEILGGELVLLPMADVPGGGDVPPEQKDLIIHAALTLGDGALLMASDDPSGDGGPAKGVSVAYNVTEVAEAERVFDALAEGGTVTQPLTETFFSPSFGMCVDRFGIPWMVTVDQSQS